MMQITVTELLITRLLISARTNFSAAIGTDCPGCRWRLDLACPQQGELCSGALVGCAAGDLRYVVRLLRPPSTDFIVSGTLCRGPGEELLAVDELADRVRDRFVELLPRAAPAVQPVEGLLVQVPAVLRSGEPESIGPVEARIAGYAVTSWQLRGVVGISTFAAARLARAACRRGSTGAQ